MGIYTKTGDGGYASTGNRKNVPKSAPVFNTLGTIDELNSALGVAKAQLNGESAAIVEALQAELIGLCAELAGGKPFATAEKVEALEKSIDALMQAVGEFTCFVLPGKTAAGASLDVARTIARRAERALVAQKGAGGVPPLVLRYVNRLSDLLYALARFADSKPETAKPAIPQASGTATNGGLMETGLTLCHTVMAEARKQGINVVCAACDAGGNLVSLLRDEGAYIASIDIAVNKAYTSVSLQMPTEALETLACEGGSLYGIQNTNGGRIVIFAGGIPLYKNGRLLGGFGVSGGSAQQDKDLVHFAQQAFEAMV